MVTIVSPIRDGKMASAAAHNRTRLALERFEGKNVAVTIGEEKDTRTLRQNRYYFGVCVSVLAEELGYEKDEMHEILKQKHLGSTVVFDGVEMVVPRSTAKLPYDEFADYIDRVKRWAAQELDIYIPDPNEA